jgi:hypothetical protein
MTVPCQLEVSVIGRRRGNQWQGTLFARSSDAAYCSGSRHRFRRGAPRGMPMFAYLSLASHPAQVQSISADRVTLVSNFSFPPGTKTAIELVNAARTFKCVLSVRVDRVQPHPGGGYTLEAEFSRSLAPDELRDLTT